jgi:hypothetical protein
MLLGKDSAIGQHQPAPDGNPLQPSVSFNVFAQLDNNTCVRVWSGFGPSRLHNCVHITYRP